MTSTAWNRAAFGLDTVALAGLLSAGLSADEASNLAEVKAAAERYRDVKVALAEGYITPDNHCVTAASEGLPAELGGMGIHYIRPDLLGITATEPRVDGTGVHTDFEKPSILVYEPRADGSLELVAVENLVFEKAWIRSGRISRPMFAGRSWDYMADDPNTPGDEAHGFEPHYDQHVWIKENPKGALEPFNPAVTCEHAAHAQ